MSGDPPSHDDLEKRVTQLEKRADAIEGSLAQLNKELNRVASALEPLKKTASRTYNRILRIFNAVREALAMEDDDK